MSKYKVGDVVVLGRHMKPGAQYEHNWSGNMGKFVGTRATITGGYAGAPHYPNVLWYVDTNSYVWEEDYFDTQCPCKVSACLNIKHRKKG